MYLANALLRELETSDLSVNDRAILICRLSKQFEAGGHYDAAQDAMSELWQGIGARPNIEGLSEQTGAEVLLRVGALTGWIGSVTQIEGSQEEAKDLISESLRTFERLGLRSKVAEARSDLALCYWRAGAFDEARVTLREAAGEVSPNDVELRARVLLRMAEVERASQRLSESLRIYNEVAPLFNGVTDALLIAHFHHGFANVLNQLGTLEHNQNYLDRALVEYAGASAHFEEAGHERYQACVENNLGVLYSSIGRFDEAHEHLDRCQVLLTIIADTLRLGQLDETRAHVFLVEDKIIEAEKVARSAVHALGTGDDALLLTEALITHGIAFARLDHPHEAQVSFQQAMNVAERAGDFESAGLAALTLIEEVSLSPKELCETLERTRTLLNKAEDIDTVRRLAKAGLRGLFESQNLSLPPDWKGFSLRKAVHDHESNLIAMALRDSDGSVSKAAHLLGFKHHQSLASLISGRHPELPAVRKPVRPRRKSLIEHSKK
jgi:tetratricopeptide (TPR) repeat protein